MGARSDLADLAVRRISDALLGQSIDVVASGSIGAIETPRFVRSLRRLGAEVFPWLTDGGAQFVTPTALSWAAARETMTCFSATTTHLATRNLCVVAPASASFIAKIAHGLADSPAAALVLSYLGKDPHVKRVVLVPNMHDSLANSPATEANLAILRRHCLVFEPRLEEGKRKFPDPAFLADKVAHVSQSHDRAQKRVLITLGGTKAMIDDVRFLGNYSSGKMGSLIAEELYRQGFYTDVIAGATQHLPHAYSRLTRAETFPAMAGAVQRAFDDGVNGAVFAAAVLDFAPDKTLAGKTSSSTSELTVKLKPTQKIIATTPQNLAAKVSFKLEVDADATKAKDIGQRYAASYGLSMFVCNNLQDVSSTEHAAWVLEHPNAQGEALTRIAGKSAVAMAVAAHVKSKLDLA